MPFHPVTSPRDAAALRRLSTAADAWRVVVETWSEPDGCRGRFVFVPEGMGGRATPREGPSALRGASREEVLASAWDVPERQLRAVLHSLS